ncbi:hypothetical protein [Phycicoccus avicenniae]|uniref:hypothetical protein n=1 Tax=Phycicoccus avicenniae TaxID=2828860 RepID=UPI003D273F90
MTRADDGGGVHNPASWLYTPVPGDPVPSTFDGVLGIADWLSLGHWALVVLDKADGSFDLQEKAQTWIAGDWEHVAIAAAALRNLKGYCESMSGAIDAYSTTLDQHWDGVAWAEAQSTMIRHSLALQKAATMLEIASKGYDDVAQGIYGIAKSVGDMVQTLIDWLIKTGISAAAASAGSLTLIGGALGAAGTFYGITQVVKTIHSITKAIERTLTVVDAIMDGFHGLLGSAGDWHLVDIPAAFENNNAPVPGAS